MRSTFRIDDQLSGRSHLFGRYSYFTTEVHRPPCLAQRADRVLIPTNSFGGTAAGRNQSAVAGMDIALSPNLLTDFRLGYLRYHVKTTKYDGNTELATQVGIPGLNISGQPFTDGAPAFYVNNASGTGGDGISNFGSSLKHRCM